MYGWGDVLDEPRRDLVTVRGAEFCDQNSPHIFCSNFNATEHETCTAVLGSPVICRNEISGFALNNETCTKTFENQTVLNYQSIEGFGEWIDEVTSHSTVENTVRFIVNVAHYTYPDLDTAITRCAASVITNVHVLTTASCVNVKAPQKIAVQATITGETGNSTSEFVKLLTNFIQKFCQTLQPQRLPMIFLFILILKRVETALQTLL